MIFFGVNVLASLAGTFAVFIVGGLWYSVLFGKQWNAAVETDMSKRLPAGVIYGSTFVMNIGAAFFFGLLLAEPIRQGWALGAGALAGLFFAAFSVTIHHLGAGRKLPVLAIDGAFQVARFTLFGLAFQLL